MSKRSAPQTAFPVGTFKGAANQLLKVTFGGIEVTDPDTGICDFWQFEKGECVNSGHESGWLNLTEQQIGELAAQATAGANADTLIETGQKLARQNEAEKN